jgi:predicted nucleotidyltransferase
VVAEEALKHLGETERRCVLRYLSLLAERLGANLVEVRLFGSAARGEMWPEWMPMHSDIDLLVLTQGAVSEEERQSLLEASYELYLECGRQLAPTFWTVARFASPEAKAADFAEQIRQDSKALYVR